jgi:hypothetical protein
MTAPRYNSSPAPDCVSPRAHRDASQRLHAYGPVRSMPDTRSIWPAVWWIASRTAVAAVFCVVVWLAIVGSGL